ncbi:MAG: PIG-L family deacetylase [Propionibacteriales bacterium]|nr:PIG-L family deacetylase [Propionibacteriales bacterium]
MRPAPRGSGTEYSYRRPAYAEATTTPRRPPWRAAVRRHASAERTAAGRAVLLTSGAVTTPVPDTQVERVLVVAAHPDDVDFGAAGTVATWTKAGIDVSYCIVTDGQAGGFDRSVSRAEMVRIRRREQRTAAVAVGAGDVRFLGYVDGELEVSRELVREISRMIREVRPQRMLIPSPERDWRHIARSHPDHLAAGEAAIRAIYPAARNPFSFPELVEDGLEPWSVPDTWLMAHRTDNHAVDITDVFDQKMRALLSHESQHTEPDELEPRLRHWLAARAQEHRLGDDRLAETFFVLSTG